MKSVMNHNFSAIPSVTMERSVFDRSHGHKTTFDGGFLVPFYVDEALPGDTFKLNATLFARLATPVFPIMDNLFLETFFFAVPNRLLWEHWVNCMGEQEENRSTNPPYGDSFADYIVPQIYAGAYLEEGAFAVGSLADYFGIPPGVSGLKISALWHRAYNLIWNEWFRDENLQEKAVVNNTDVDDFDDNYPLRRRGKRHDYFTSALPWPQKGPGVEIPLGTSAPVLGTGQSLGLTDGVAKFGVGHASYTLWHSGVYGQPLGAAMSSTDAPANRSFGVVTNQSDSSGLYADLSSATAATINSLRQAFQIQKLLERDARGGTRYPELILSHFKVRSPDARLQRPEYLGGSSCRININPVVQQTRLSATQTDQLSALGTLAGYGVAADGNVGFTKSFTEHMTIIGLVNVRADLSYQQGVPRMFNRKTRFDFYWPALAHLGEQEILNQEIYVTSNQTQNALPFGYQERWAEYRFFPSKITGLFRSNIGLTLDRWHLAQAFGSLPVLNDEFIVDEPPLDRVIAVPSQPHIIFDSYMQLHCARPMPVYSVPGLIDHF